MRKICTGCGTRPEEWERDSNAYIGDIVYCPGCERLEQERDNIPEGSKGTRPSLLPKAEALERAKTLGDNEVVGA